MKNLGYLVNNGRNLATPSLSADGKYFFFQARSPEVYLDNLEKKMTYAELQEREINNPENNGEDIFWVGTEYIDIIKELEYLDVSGAMLNMIMEKDVETAIDLYWELKNKYNDVYDFSEPMLNSLGYGVFRQEEYKIAIELFKLYVEVFPESWNVYDSLGEAYMVNGDFKHAIKNYKKSLEQNPENTNAMKTLKKLESK